MVTPRNYLVDAEAICRAAKSQQGFRWWFGRKLFKRPIEVPQADLLAPTELLKNLVNGHQYAIVPLDSPHNRKLTKRYILSGDENGMGIRDDQPGDAASKDGY